MNREGPAANGSRRRAVAFGVLALIAAVVSAGVANGYGSSVAESYGPLRQVIVIRAPLDSTEVIGPGAISEALETRRVPERFVPPGTLVRAHEALGLRPTTDLVPGAYLLSSQLEPPPRKPARAPGLRGGRQPVEIAVTGAGALLATGSPVTGTLVDVVVTTEPRGAGPGRTFVAAAGVPILGLAPGQGPGPETAAATLAVTRPQALELIEAENFARQVRLLPRAQAVDRRRGPG